MVLLVVASQEGTFILVKSFIQDCLTDIVDSTDDKVLVMNACEDFGSDFVGSEEMMKISTRVIFTTFTITFWVDWGEIVGVLSVFDVKAAIQSIKRAVSCHASGADAIKSIAAELGTNK